MESGLAHQVGSNIHPSTPILGTVKQKQNICALTSGKNTIISTAMIPVPVFIYDHPQDTANQIIMHGGGFVNKANKPNN